jgi:hypothetical protein
VSRRSKQLKSHKTAGVNPRPTSKFYVRGRLERFADFGIKMAQHISVLRLLFGAIPLYRQGIFCI